MGKIGFLFAGQGAQAVGMGKDLFEKREDCKELFLKGDKILNMNLLDLMFNGDAETLKQTNIAQPAIVLTSIAAAKALENEGVVADYSAGLSLGEYSALINENVISFEDGMKLVKERGRIMGLAGEKHPGKMAAILKLNKEKIEELVDSCKDKGIIEVANYNCPGQIVVGGEGEAIDKCIGVAKELGGMAIPLKVSGAFHTSLLKEASVEFYEYIKDIDINKLEKNIYSNLKGDLYSENDDIKEILKNHMIKSVYFEDIIKDMISKGVDTFIEIGPGKTLTGFVKKIDRKVKTLNVYDLETLNACIETIKSSN